MLKKIWLIGSGLMAIDYIKVLEALKGDILVIGRGEDSAKACFEATGCEVKTGGLETFLFSKPEICSYAIVAVGVEKLSDVTLHLLNYGVKNILIEKPAGLNQAEISVVALLAREKNADVFVAYNRRFYASTLKAQEIIEADGGVTSFNFEFTEWAHVINDLKTNDGVKEKWFLANSTHVVDLAFYLGGHPKEFSSYTSGGLSWHPSASVFAGAGLSKTGALFAYHANWSAPGRWGVEILTSQNRLIFRPMEKLHIQRLGSVEINEVPLDDDLDQNFKPGLYLQCEMFLDGNNKGLCDIHEHLNQVSCYNKMSNYNKPDKLIKPSCE